MLNPIIYSVWNIEFRKTFINILRGQFVKRKHYGIRNLVHMSAQQMAQTAADRKAITVVQNPVKQHSKWQRDVKGGHCMESTVLLQTTNDRSLSGSSIVRL